MTNLDDKQSKGTHWTLLFIDRHTTVHFNSFGIEYIPQEVLNKIKGKSITDSIFRIMCGFYCIAFIEYMLAGKPLFDCFLLMAIKRMTR